MIFLVFMVERWLLILLESLNNFKIFSNSFHNSIDFTVNISISKDMVVGARLDNPLPNGGFKTCSDVRCLLCKHSINMDSFKSPIMGRTYKLLDNTSCRKDYFCKVCSKQFIRETDDLRKRINNHLSTTKTKKINKPIAELFNVRCHKWEDIAVVLLTIILIGRTRKGKGRKTSGFTDLNYSDLI